MKKSPLLRSLVLSLVMLTTLPTFAAVKKEFNVCWTIYAGWMPWGTISNSKIIDKWADKYGIKINIVQLNDYIESINQYTAGQFDGCTMTNMDALTIPAAGGVDSTALILGSYSEGNDGVVMKGEGKTLKDLKGQQIYLPELSVSHYLLVRGLEKAGLAEKDVTVVNTSDADIVSAFATPKVQAAVAWNPQLSVIKGTPKTTEVFSSSQVPGELIDMMVVNTQTLKDNPTLGKALTGAWYEMMAQMKAQNKEALSAMAAAPIWRAIRRSLKPPISSTPRPIIWRLSAPRIWRKPCSALRHSPLKKGCWVTARKVRISSAWPFRATFLPGMPPT